jgi:hypothetical protein
MFEAVHIEAHKDLLVVSGDVGALSRSRTMWRSSAFILALTCTSSRDAQANAVETCRLVDVSRLNTCLAVCRTHKP